MWKYAETEDQEIVASQMAAVAVAAVVVAGEILELEGEFISELGTSAAGVDTLSGSSRIC